MANVGACDAPRVPRLDAAHEVDIAGDWRGQDRSCKIDNRGQSHDCESEDFKLQCFERQSILYPRFMYPRFDAWDTPNAFPKSPHIVNSKVSVA